MACKKGIPLSDRLLREVMLDSSLSAMPGECGKWAIPSESDKGVGWAEGTVTGHGGRLTVSVPRSGEVPATVASRCSAHPTLPIVVTDLSLVAEFDEVRE